MHRFRVLVVDDFREWRDYARCLLEKVPDLVIVAEASDGLEAVQKAEEHQPDLILLDIALPSLNGFDVARRIRRTCESSKIIFLTADHHYAAAEGAVPTRASAYLLKSRAATELVPAVRAALNSRQVVRQH